ncbi:T9SS type A sorting domain-containing protein [Mucilaginibacter myungsuensis]|uniref:T9SS type A sorting domain-containing protein n=1 Tax=Mucilaginibacter myungsuensis TaxID=649104 RepID=A0A929KZP9_9SPHI|nr:T9SS type A sorting domain-containing protein [Mucilaginibacter myungsuensis]MBE9664167.1 T9SS type A sorting domain-containing protein [Mucilaginibacter myungsuensis]MDN3599870.1 T9SS type A sorting domain-containing protein [Mucilaginibacter myungsuensis]
MKKLLRNYFLLIFLPALFVFLGEKASAQTATFTTRTGGLQPTGNGNPITQGQTQVPLIGFSISVSGGSITFKNFNIGSNKTLDNFIANGTLYRSTTNGGTYNPAAKGTPVGTATISGSNISIDNLLETVSSTEVYYFFVADAIYNNASIEYDGQIYINSGNFATDINNNNNYQYYSNYRGYTWSSGSSPYPLSVSNNTTGLSSTSTLLTASMANNVLLAFSIKNNSSTTRTISNVNINSNLTGLQNYFSAVRLYTNTSNTYATAAGNQVGGTTTINTSSSYAGFTLTTNNTIAAGATRWFWFVADRNSSAFASTDVQFNFQSGQSTSSIITSGPTNFNTATIFGSIYNINYSNITIVPTTGLTGLKANGSTLTAKEADVVAFGFRMTSTTAITVSQFNINSNNNSIGTYFGNGRVYYINSATYTTGTRGTAVGTVAFSGNYATVTMTAQNTFTGSNTRYYYVVMDNIAPASTTTSVAFNFTSGQSANAVTISAPAASTFNTFSGNGNSLTLPSPTIYVTTNTNGLNTSAIAQGQNDIVLYGFAVEAFGSHTFTNFRIRTSGSENGYFSNARLIKSTSSTFPGVSSPAYSGVDVCGCSLIRASVNETVPSGTTYYYWLVADYTVTWGTTPVANYSFNFQSGQGEAAFVSSSPNTSYNNITTTANTFAIGGLYDWVAGSSTTAFGTAGNWRINGSTPATPPGANDVARIGVIGYYNNYQPTIAAGSIPTVGKIIFGTNNTPVLTVTGTLYTLTVNKGIDVTNNGNAKIVATGVFVSLPSTATSTLGTSATLTLDGGGYTHGGTMTIGSGGSIAHSNSLTGFTNSSTGSVTMNGTSTFSESAGFNNDGSFVHNGTGAITLTSTLDNSGTFTAGGNFSLTGALTNNSPGALTLGSGTSLFSSTVANAAGASITMGSGTTTFSGAVTNNGTLTAGGGAITFTGAFANNTSGATATLNGAGTRTFSNTINNVTGATITLGSGATSVNGVITNNGTFTAGAGNLSAASDLTNGGTFNGGSGTHDFNGTNFTNSGTFNLSSGTSLIVATTFANSGTVVSNGAGTVNFDRGGVQAINNTNASISAPASVAFNNLILSGSGTKTLTGTATGGKFSIAPSGTLTVSNGITFAVAAGTNNYLTLLSDATGSAQVAALSTGVITGQLSVERYISGGDKALRSYRLLSASVSQSATTPFYINFANFANANAAANLNGNNVYTGGPGTGFSITQATPSIYLYDERPVPAAGFNAGKTKGITQLNTGTTPTTVNIAAGTSLSTGIVNNQNVPIGNGFMIYNVGHTGQTTPNLTSSTPAEYKITQKGYLNQGNIPVTLWFTPTGGAGKLSYTSSLAAPGYNMLGNPYASTLDLTAFVNANSSIESYIYQLGSDNTGGQAYVAWNRGLQSSPDATRYVASGQGFFVKAKTANSTVTFTELQKASAQNPNAGFFMSTDPLAAEPVTGFYIKLEKDIENYDHCGIYFGKDYNDNYLKEEDALDIDGASPKVYMSSYSADGRRTAINASADYKGGKTIKLYVNAIEDGTYTLRIQDIKNMDTNYDIWLVDNLKSDSVNLTVTDNHSFNITRSDATTYGGERFKLVIKRKPMPPYKFLSLKGQVAGRVINLTWNTQNEGNYVGFTVERLNANKQYDPLKYFVSNGAGTYNFIDNNPNRGVNVYRIKQDDIDHKISYSKDLSLLLIDGNTKDKKFNLFPNPVASDPLNVKFVTEIKGSVKITVVNAAGYIMLTSTTTQQQTTIDVSSLKSGAYFVKAVSESTGESIGSETFIKL